VGEVVWDASFEYFELCVSHRCGCNMNAKLRRFLAGVRPSESLICGECSLLLGSVGAFFLKNYFQSVLPNRTMSAAFKTQILLGISPLTAFSPALTEAFAITSASWAYASFK
jgi:hypothetical protein